MDVMPASEAGVWKFESSLAHRALLVKWIIISLYESEVASSNLAEGAFM